MQVLTRFFIDESGRPANGAILICLGHPLRNRPGRIFSEPPQHIAVADILLEGVARASIIFKQGFQYQRKLSFSALHPLKLARVFSDDSV